jgi:DNA-binding SARP family transcriptional activator/tetratricopeptide (TPR) repeat protein/TolB-like protein
MVQLTVLGDVKLRTGDGRLVGSVLSQPRRLALLVYLALESHGAGVQRDRLLGVFWPELPQEQARQALRTALSFLRRSLGAHALTGGSGAVAVDAGTVACDAAAFGCALRAGDAESALQLYRGDLLPGFYLDGGPLEFERWLETTRSRLRRDAAEAAWSLAAREEDAGNAAGAGAWARRAVQLCDGDEPAVRRAMEILARVGDRAGALAAFQGLARRLDEDFGSGPSPETAALGDLVRAGGVPGGEKPARRLPAAVAASGDGPSPATRTRPRASWPDRARAASRHVYSAAVTVALGVAFYSLWGLAGGGPTPSTGSMAAAPLLQVEEIRDFSPEGSTADLAGALTLEISARLSEVQTLRVVPPGAADAAVTGDLATYVLRGGLLRADTLVRVTAMLLDGRSGATLDRITAEHPIGPVAETTAGLADVLVRRIRREMGRVVEARERDARARSPQALAMVRAARQDMEVGDSLGTAGAVDAAVLAFQSADSLFAQAQAAAPAWPEPSIQRGELAYRRMWLLLPPPAADPDGAARALRAGVGHLTAALGIAPDDPAALETRGLLNYWLWRLRAGGSEAADDALLAGAEADLTRATQIDAGRGRAWSVLSALYDTRGNFAAANLAARRAHQVDPYLENAIETVVRLFTTSLEIGDRSAAAAWCDEIQRRMPDSWLPAFCRLEHMAWNGAAPGLDEAELRELIDATVSIVPGARHVPADLEMLRAVILARSGAPAAAMAAIETARSVGSQHDTHLLVLEAWARLALGDASAATNLLRSAAAADPRAVRPMLHSRRFEELRAEGRLTGLVDRS